MTDIPRGNYNVAIFSPKFIKDVDKYKAMKNAKNPECRNDNKALTGSLNALSCANRYGIHKYNPEGVSKVDKPGDKEALKEACLKMIAEATAEELRQQYGLDETSLPTEEVEDMVKNLVDEKTQEIKEVFTDTIQKMYDEHKYTKISFAELEKLAEESESGNQEPNPVNEES